MCPINLARYRFTFRVEKPIRLPDYAGSTLRGAFGHALRSVNCVTKEKECKGCPLIAQCPYAQVFSPHDIPRENMALHLQNQIPVPYIIEAPLRQGRSYLEGEELSFDMVLMGDALTHLAVIILAWRRAFLRGIGNGDGTASIVKVSHCGLTEATIYSEDAPLIVPHITQVIPPRFTQPEDVHLHFLTPLRLQQQGKVVSPRDMTASIFLRQLIRRVTMQIQLQQPDAFSIEKIRELNALADQVQDERRLQWQDWSRFSSRQNQKMTLGGLTGHMLLKNVPVELLPLINIGQYLHLGKETSFGLGGYKIVQAEWLPMMVKNITEMKNV
jgi:hypothetical protein